MIITKSWLNEWIDVEKQSLEDLVKTLNSIGIEVDDARHLKAPDKVVVGFVKEKIKHENSDKLNICKVDVGNEVLQIICGAANVEVGQFVPVALKGAIMPNGMQIKEAKLRGVDSYGMICSSNELGFAKVNDGILVLDESIGKLELGKALNRYTLFNDELIEVELTPNRGDCLSIYGIARDLSAALDLDFRKIPVFKDDEKVLAIGRILKLVASKELNSFHLYKVIELKQKFETTLLINLRLAQIDSLNSNSIENLLNYTTHSTGVLFNAYDLHSISKKNSEFVLNLNKENHGETKIMCQDKPLSVSGICQEKGFKLGANSKIIILEAHYTKPFIIAEAKDCYKKQDEKLVYRSFRGSEPKLNIGMNFLLHLLQKNPDIIIYSSSQQILEKKENSVIDINVENISKIIGQEVHKDTVLKILKKLKFESVIHGEHHMSVKIPLHRPDIVNLADICEEIVRMIGIDNIASKGLEFTEKNRINETYKEYKKLLILRNKAADNGYFESLHYVLDNEEELKELGFELAKLKLINPITAELSTLRTTLLNHLLNAASFNIKNSKKIIKLFESGAVFNAANEEFAHMALIHCGFKEEAGISNKAKPALVDFYSFLSDIKNILGAFELKNSNHSFLSPYEQADLYVNGVKIGFLGRLNLELERKKDLLQTYVCEFDLNLFKQSPKIAKLYSKFPSVSRDLSILIPKDFSYEKVKNCIEGLKLDFLESFRVVDLYDDESLKGKLSLTINFVFKSLDKTLEEAEISACMDKILKNLEKLGLSLR
ncbi:MAG: phenylalanine--tRNA ligase subunit beta [Campylobacter sp.]|nr:phenylalanine--tRNA ligase subunit beta [Campylobacter sp.]